ncbi:hypothetical protein STRTUCAR8_04792, partial [Streptomyces turgidiscabies Car8]
MSARAAPANLPAQARTFSTGPHFQPVRNLSAQARIPSPSGTSQRRPAFPARPAFEDKARSGPERGSGGAAPRNGMGRVGAAGA